MIYLQLFFSFVQIGLFSFGGGYAALPLIQHQVVTVHKWLTVQEFADVVTISQLTPGPIAINAASFVGTRVAGIGGAIVATCGNVFPSLIIVLVLAWLFFTYKDLKIMQGILFGLRPAVVALIASAGVSILLFALFGDRDDSSSHVSYLAILLFILGFLLMRKKKINPIIIILSCGGITTLLSFIGVFPVPY